MPEDGRTPLDRLVREPQVLEDGRTPLDRLVRELH